MASTYYHKEYYNVENKENGEKNGKQDIRMPLSGKLLIVGVYALLVAISTGVVWYSTTHGIYIDPTCIQ